MVTYDEVKALFCMLTDGHDDGENGDIIITIRNYYHMPNVDADQEIIISNAELQELYNTVCEMNVEGLQLYTHSQYEVAVDMDGPLRRRVDDSLVLEDTENSFKYELSMPTKEYLLYILMLMEEARNGRNMRYILPRIRHMLGRLRAQNTDISLTTILQTIVGELTLKITSTSPEKLSVKDFVILKNSFIFEYMYKTGIPVIEFPSINDMFPFDNYLHGRQQTREISSPPLRIYSEDVVDYYKQALASNDAFIKYISYYHVMEYFFDEVFKRRLVYDLKRKITHPDFSYKNDEKIYEIANFVKNRLRLNDETGQGNELESLKYVLTEYVTIEELKDRINAIDTNAIQYYQNNKVSFCNAPFIGWADMVGVYTQLAKRIYFTRNSLVHSKSSKNKERYRPYKDEKELELEIPLVKAIAELIIIGSSRLI